MTSDFPAIVKNTPENVDVLRKVFSYHAEEYDLAAYEAVSPGLGKRVWDMIEAERSHQSYLAEQLVKYPQLKEMVRGWGYNFS